MIREEDFLQIFDQVLNIPEETLNALPQKMLDSMIEGLKSEEVIQEQVQEMREAGLTKREVHSLQSDLINTIEVVKEEIQYDTLSQKRKDLIDALINAVLTGIEEITLRYGVYDIRIPTKLLHENAKLPAYAHTNDGGADVYAIEDIEIPAKATGLVVPTGLAIQIPVGWIVSVRPRSGMCVKTTLRIANSPGTIERGFYDQVGIIFDNLSDDAYTIKQGDRIAQFIVERRYSALYTETKEFDTTDSRENKEGVSGFGSTGK